MTDAAHAARPQTAPPLPTTFDAARPYLLGRAFGGVPYALRLRELRLQGVDGYSEIALPVAGDVYVGAILDLSTSDVPVTTAMLEQWGVTHADVVGAATVDAQPPASSRVGDVTVVQGAASVAAMLRDPDALQRLVDTSGRATPFAIVPRVDVLVAARAHQPQGIANAARIAEGVLDGSPNPVSAQPLVRQGDGWAVAAWPDEARDAGARLRRRFDAFAYARLRTLLQVHYDRTDEVAVIADATLEERDGRLVTWAALHDGVRTVLPIVDEVELRRDGIPAQRVPMDRLRGIDGLLTPIDGTTPQLLFPTRFPQELLAR